MLNTDEEKFLFENLYNEHKTTLFNIAYNILKDVQLSEDVVHETFLSLASNMKKIIGNNSIQTRNYLIIIVRNHAFKTYNKSKKEICTNDVYEEIPDAHNLEIDIESKTTQEALFCMIKELDEKYADALMLKYFYDMKHKDIAKLLGISVENVKIRINRGKKLLKEKLMENEYYDKQTV